MIVPEDLKPRRPNSQPSPLSYRQIEFLPLQYPVTHQSLAPSPETPLQPRSRHLLGIVDVEKVRIQNRLHSPRHPRYGIHIPLRKIPIQPVGDIQRPVDAEREEVVRRDGIGLAGTLQHKKLGEDGDGLEPDGEGPQHLGELVAVGEEDGEDGAAAEEVLDFEGVNVGVVRGLVVVEHEEDDVGLRGEEEDLEGGVPDGAGGEGPENVYGEMVSCGVGGGGGELDLGIW